MTMTGREVVLLAEVADLLAQHGALHCSLVAENTDGAVTLQLQFHDAPEVTEEARLARLEFWQELRELQDLAQLRALAQRFDIPSVLLEPYIAAKEKP